MKALPIIKYLFALLSLFCCLSCSPSDEAVPEEDNLCHTDSVTYAGTIVPILETNCYTCHDASNAPTFAEGIILEGYDNIVIQVNKGRLLGAIRHQPGFTAMPRNLPQLPECTIREIETWVEAGAPDN
jgi:hypothetical protein